MIILFQNTFIFIFKIKNKIFVNLVYGFKPTHSLHLILVLPIIDIDITPAIITTTIVTNMVVKLEVYLNSRNFVCSINRLVRVY